MVGQWQLGLHRCLAARQVYCDQNAVLRTYLLRCGKIAIFKCATRPIETTSSSTITRRLESNPLPTSTYDLLRQPFSTAKLKATYLDAEAQTPFQHPGQVL